MSERLKRYVHRWKVLGIKICNNFTISCEFTSKISNKKKHFRPYFFLYLAYRIDIFCRMLDVMVYWDQRKYWTDAGYVEETIRVYPDRHRNLRGHSRDTVNVHRLVV